MGHPMADSKADKMALNSGFRLEVYLEKLSAALMDVLRVPKQVVEKAV